MNGPRIVQSASEEVITSRFQGKWLKFSIPWKGKGPVETVSSWIFCMEDYHHQLEVRLHAGHFQKHLTMLIFTSNHT